MPSITKRTNKSGAASYLIRVFVEEGPSGKQVTKSMTWKPPAGMRPSAADKQAEKEAVLFAQKVRSGVVSIDGKTTFAEYAARWMENGTLSLKAKDQYDYLLKRIRPAIGHIPLEKIKVHHIQGFLKNLRENGIRISGKYAVSIKLDNERKSAKLTHKALAEKAGVSVATVEVAAHGKHVSINTARKISSALDMPIEALFAIKSTSSTLSDRTIWHHHKLIRTILAAAKKERLIPHNVAGEFMDAPKLPRSEAKYMDDDEARTFLDALLNEPDIRIRTALILDLFTGMRRGELCGLSWLDVDLTAGTIHILRASQYIQGHGIVETSTKNSSSTRIVTITPFVVEILRNYRSWWLERKISLGDKWQGDAERLFIQEDGKPIYPGTINTWLKRLIKKNSLPDIHPHTLRHTFVTLQLSSGVDIRTLQSRTGHAQASTLLNLYSHAIQSAQERAAQALDDVLLHAKRDGRRVP